MLLKNKKNPLVTVIVPFYNEKRYIEKCLLSIKNQSYKKIELIVINDESKDGSEVIAKKYANVFLSQRHSGPGQGRNKAAKIAKGEILVFIDADMYLEKGYIKKIIKPILLEKSYATFTKEEYIANPENIWVRCYSIDNNLKGVKKNIESSMQSNYFRAIQKDFFLSLGGYSLQYGYADDNLNYSQVRIKSTLARNAICYHANPDNLYDVYQSSRWMGRSPIYKRTFRNIIRYSPINSLIISFKKIYLGAPASFIFYKLVFDLGILTGIFCKNSRTNYAK